MQEHAAVFRTGAVLADGCRKVDDIYKQTEDLKVPKIKLNFCSVTKRLFTIDCRKPKIEAVMHNGQLQQTNANNAMDALEILCEPVVFGLLGHFFFNFNS